MKLSVAARLYIAGTVVLAVLVLPLLVLVEEPPHVHRLGLMLAIGAVLVIEHFFQGRLARQSGHGESYGHEESFLVAMALLTAPFTIALAFGAAVLTGNVLLRRAPVKTLFNVATMLVAGGAGLLVVALVGRQGETGPREAFAVVVASAVFLVVNNTSVSGLLALLHANAFVRNLTDDLGGRTLIWAGNTAIGLLAGLAGAAHTWTLPFGVVAMFVLHFAFSGHIEARAEHQKLEDMLESSSDGILSLNRRDEVASWNPACEAITRYGEAEVLGLTLSQLLSLLGAEREGGAPLSELDSGGAEAELVRVRAKDDELRWIALTHATLPEGGAVVVLRDETSRRKVDELMARAESERLKSDLVATVSHELRTPLTSILGFTKTLLARDVDESERQRYLGIMQVEAARLAELIDDFLDLRLIAEGRFALERHLVDLREVLEHQAALFAGESHAHRVHVEVPPEPLRVLGERDRLSQVLSNLISNAIKYSPAGGDVSVRGEAENGVVRVSVADSGLGIPREAHEGVFTRFFRVDSKAHRAIGGSGLGLAVAREIVTAHGGRIGFDSVEGKGSTFWFELPVSPRASE